ncbi:Uncharacterised protein [Corynebacterium minutissimum]|uniref:Uncharacterized protein n=1 Tax=Corynebacterium minutissimum TaxID=38301 RepID=A0A2X4UMG0_9CORY|nr:Uncharacterised protein [Corynebacterium minutissimum]VEG06555.1 Uncharacterised protein [Corynebacterium minutissimum]
MLSLQGRIVSILNRFRLGALGINSRPVEIGINSDVNRIGGAPRRHAEKVLAKCRSSCVRTELPLVSRCRSPIGMFRVGVTSQSRIFYNEARTVSPKKHAVWSFVIALFQADSLDRPDLRRIYSRGRAGQCLHFTGIERKVIKQKRAQTAVRPGNNEPRHIFGLPTWSQTRQAPEPDTHFDP